VHLQSKYFKMIP